MLIFKCDSCQETISERNKITVRYQWEGVELCPACGWQIVDLLVNKNLIKLQKNQIISAD